MIRFISCVGLYGASAAGSPTSPAYDYAFCDSRNGAGASSHAMGNPIYNNKLRISESIENGQGAVQPNDEQPVYQELVDEQVYADPSSNQGQDNTPQSQPIYREVEDEALGSPIYREVEDEALGSPIYREVEEPPLYAETTEIPIRPEGSDPTGYQELNYASRKPVYQPLEDEWKSKKFSG